MAVVIAVVVIVVVVLVVVVAVVVVVVGSCSGDVVVVVLVVVVVICTCACTCSCDVVTSKLSKLAQNSLVFDNFDFQRRFAPQRRALLRHLEVQKWSEHVVF